jgi:flagellar basal-body rod modification protein FlgD
MSTTTGITPATGQTALPTSSSGSTGLTSGDFMKLMINQLQHQDPLNPTDSNALLQQIAQISTLQSNSSLQSTLTSLSLQQSIGAGGNLIGKAVTGLDAGGNTIDGLVTGVQVQNQQVFLTLDNDISKVVPMQNVTTITQPLASNQAAASTQALTPAAPAAASSTAATTTPSPTNILKNAATNTTDAAKSILNALSGLTS